MNCSGKVVVITGGATGIGFGIAKVLADHSARIVIAQRNLQRGLEAAQRLQPAEVIAVKLDIRDYVAVQRCIEMVANRFGQIDALVNNASVTGRTAILPFLESSPEFIGQIVDTNLKGTIYCSVAAALRMVESKRGGAIVNISSVGAYAAQENASIYCATKAAQVMLTKAMALELARYGIRVNCIAPGAIDNEGSTNASQAEAPQEADGKFIRLTPLGRDGEPEEIGRAVAFLISEDASFITGTTLVVDGGFLSY
jgi:NAD(P)-dependent dehydrogenase (short-subunit alcohol dehydrogenase family)